jgi:phage terminase large subunit-like protein
MRSGNEIAADAESYVRGVTDGSIVAGRFVKLAVARHLRDVESGPARGLFFNAARAKRALWWIENRCRFSKGEWAKRPFRFQPWQAFIVWSLFGWERYVDGHWIRRFRVGYISVARKNGKSEMVAAIGLLMLVCAGEAEAGGEVYAAATKLEQAAIVWRAAASMVRKSPMLKKDIGIHDSAHNLAHYENESKFEALASDSDTLDGLNPILGIVDEYHAHTSSDLYDVIDSGMGARREPLMLVTTTAGGKRQGPCWDLESDGVKVLEGIGEAEGTGDELFVFIARLDLKADGAAEDDDWQDPAVWPKANPNMGVSVHPEKLRVGARVALRRVGALNEFLRKHMNLWTEVSTAWLPMPAWDACAASTPHSKDLERDGLKGETCYVGIDLSAVSDYTAGAAVFPPTAARPFWDVLPGFWIPMDTLMERKQKDRVPVERWVEQEYVTATSGPVVDQDAVKLWLIALRERYNVAGIPMDPHNATKLQTELVALGFKVHNMRQGWVTMSPAIKETEILIRKGLIRHGGNPVLRWMFSNVALKRDPNDNLSLNKGRSGDRIDGITSMVMGIGFAGIQAAEKPSVYERRGPLVFGGAKA